MRKELVGYASALADAKRDLAQELEFQARSNHAEYYEKNIAEKKQRVRNLQYLHRMFKGSVLYQKMNEMVQKVVKHYHADFYFHDLRLMMNYEGRKFCWIIGDCGTHFVPLEASDEEEAKSFKDHLHALQHSYGGYATYVVDPVKETIKKADRAKLQVKIVEANRG